MLVRFAFTLLTSVTLTLTAAPPDQAERIYQAIRDNDLATLRTLIKSAGVNAREKRGATPLMLAAAYGSLDAMKLLIAAGADVNAKNDFDATALLWSTYDLDRVRLLVDKGADVNAASKQKRTPLIVAASQNGTAETVRLLLEKGASPAAHDFIGVSPLVAAASTRDPAIVKLLLDTDPRPSPMDLGRALQNASGTGTVENIRMLLAWGADVNAASPPELAGRVKNGPIALGKFTPLLLAVAYGGADAVKVLLDAGAKPDVVDVRGMTPMTLAIATDRPDLRILRLLIEKGASLSTKNLDGETAIDWARKYNQPKVLDALGLPPAKAPALINASTEKLPDLRDAVRNGLALLQKTSDSFLITGGCVGCHAQNLSGLAVSAARANGFGVDEKSAKDQSEAARLSFVSQEQLLLQAIAPPGDFDVIMYSAFHLAAEKAPADRTTDAMIHYFAASQNAGGPWRRSGVARPPLEDGDFTMTALGLRLFQIYGPAGRRAEFTKRIEQAAKWLAAEPPINTEDLNFQLLGLKWAKHNQAAQEAALRKLRANQRRDGGWGQTPELSSDAYATGQTLYTLHELGVPATDEAYRRGVGFLLQTQKPDGSWYVKSRALKFQPYFQSGFPHDHDQWISAAATAWATAGLAYAAPAAKTVAAVR